MYGTFETKKKYFVQGVNAGDKDLWHHPTIKPMNIIQTLVINSSCEGDIVLDPFMGSGTTAVACMKEKRHFLGFEIEPKYYDIALQRIEIQQSELSLF